MICISKCIRSCTYLSSVTRNSTKLYFEIEEYFKKINVKDPKCSSSYLVAATIDKETVIKYYNYNNNNYYNIIIIIILLNIYYYNNY